jgi:hypothetical protein
VLNFAVIPVMFDHWANHDRKLLNDKIDTLIIGDSFGKDSVQPSIIDKTFNCCSFNSCTVNQNFMSSYYTLLDFEKTSKIKNVYLAVDYYNFLPESQENDATSTDVQLRRFLTLQERWEYSKNTLTFDDLTNRIFRFTVYKSSVADIKKNVADKLSTKYRNYEIMNGNDVYYDKGYVYSTEKISNYITVKFDMNNLSESSVEWFEKIVKNCHENGIKLNVFHPPLTEKYFNSIKNYDNYYNTISKILSSYGYTYYDFNYYYERSVLNESESFKNSSHLNHMGSTVFMGWLCKVYSSEPEEAEALFTLKK